MNNVFFIKDRFENRISFFHLILFLWTLPFDHFYSTLVLISWTVQSVIFLHAASIKKPDRTLFILQSVFYVTLISTIYNFKPGLETLGKQFALLLFPVLFYITSLNLEKYRHRILELMTYGCCLTILYLFFDAFHVIQYHHLPLLTLFSWQFVNQNFSLPIGMHATYLSMSVVLAMIFCIRQVFSRVEKNRMLYGFIFLILLAGLIQLSSKSAIFAWIIIMFFGFPVIQVGKADRGKYLACSIAFIVVMIPAVLSFHIFRERYVITLKDDLYQNRTIAEINGRHDRWAVAWDLIKKAPLLGTGSGSEINLLRQSYFDRKMYGPYLASLNAHNQYLSFLINSGIYGLLIYLFTLMWGLIHAIRHRDIFLFSFIVLIIIVSISEDLLEVNKGIFFYAFYFSFLIRSLPKEGDDREILQPALGNNVFTIGT